MKYMPWIRNIYIVTANQTPAWIKKSERIKIIDHSEILPSSVLPTFNSAAIEQGIKNIEGLSEYYFYMNDDFFVMKNTNMDTFMDETGHKFYSWNTRPNCNKQCKLIFQYSQK